jgi:hypothetical protein
MGAVASSAGGARGGDGTVLGDLPENCVAEVLLRLDPLEICRMARLSRTFRGAASGDGVWESKLPRNYARLLAVAAAGDGEGGQAAASAPGAELLPKKELYARLCRRNRFDGGKKVLIRLLQELHVTSLFCVVMLKLYSLRFVLVVAR